MTDAERAARLRQVRTLVDELSDGDAVAPAKRLALQVSDEIDRWMTRRGATWCSTRVRRSTLARCLKGRNVTLSSVSDVAAALDCDVRIEFVPRLAGRIYETVGSIYATAPLSDAAGDFTVNLDNGASADVCTPPTGDSR